MTFLAGSRPNGACIVRSFLFIVFDIKLLKLCISVYRFRVDDDSTSPHFHAVWDLRCNSNTRWNLQLANRFTYSDAVSRLLMFPMPYFTHSLKLKYPTIKNGLMLFIHGYS